MNPAKELIAVALTAQIEAAQHPLRTVGEFLINKR